MKVQIKLTPNKLSEILYGEDYHLEGWSTKQINKLLKENAKALQRIYDCIDSEDYDRISCSDLYILGDMINLLSQIDYSS